MAIFAVEARESLVDRNTPACSAVPRNSVEARESLVDRNIVFLLIFCYSVCRGSREPRGSKYTISTKKIKTGLVEARESLVDRNTNTDNRMGKSAKSRLARASWIEI